MRRRAAPSVVIVALLVAGCAATIYKLSLVRGIDDIGHADEVAYVEVADSLIHGRGFDVNYVSFFFRPYGREITHREDHWPPLLSFAIAPFLFLFGNTPFSARIAPILIGSFLLPFATAWLGWIYSRRSYVALLAGLCMLGNAAIFNDSMRTMADVATTTITTAFLACVLLARVRPRAHAAGGLLIAAGFYVKGSLLMLIGLYPLLVAIVSGWRALRSRWLHAGLAGAIVLISPWLISNLHCYGNPFHSTQNYMSGALGVQAFDVAFLKPYWGNGLPRVSDRWRRDPAKYRQYMKGNRESITLYAVMGPTTNLQAWSDAGPIGAAFQRLLSSAPPARGRPAGKPIGRWQEPITSLCGISAIFFSLILLAGGSAIAVLRGLRLVRTRVSPNSQARAPAGTTIPHPVPASPGVDGGRVSVGDSDGSAGTASAGPAIHGPFLSILWRRWIGGPELLRPTLAVLLFLLIHWGFMAYLWRVLPRYSYPLLPPMAVIGCTALSRLIEVPLSLAPRRWVARVPMILTTTIAAVTLLFLLAGGGTLRRHLVLQDRVGVQDFRQVRPGVSYKEMGRWIAANVPDAVVMARNPWELLYYCGPRNKTVNLPYAEPGDIFSVARYYRVTHFLADQTRPGLDAFLSGAQPGMTPVPGAPGRLFRLDYDRLPDSGLTGASTP